MNMTGAVITTVEDLLKRMSPDIVVGKINTELFRDSTRENPVVWLREDFASGTIMGSEVTESVFDEARRAKFISEKTWSGHLVPNCFRLTEDGIREYKRLAKLQELGHSETEDWTRGTA